MPIAFVANKDPYRDYSRFKSHTLATVTAGDNYRLEDVVRILSHAQSDDVLLLDRSPQISAVCLAVWLELFGVAHVYSFEHSTHEWIAHSVTRDSIRRAIERNRLEAAHGIR